MVFREEPSSYEKFGAGRIAFEEDNQIVLLNDNNGRLFEFEWVKYGDKISSELIVKDKLVYNRHNRKPPVENIQTVPSEYLNGALGAQYSADTLSIMIDDEVVDVGLKGVLDTQQFSAKAAIISLGQFVKMAAARELDVVPEEFSSGVQVRFSERVKAKTLSLFISDALENGSGLTRIISKPKKLRTILKRHYETINWEEKLHKEKCDTSCANCMRTYQNLSEHHFLDWRLALDMVDLLLGHPLNFDRWFQEAFTFSETFVDNFNKRYGDTAKLEFGTFEELPVLFERTRRKALICSHPLWHCEKENKFQENAREQVHADIQSNINVKF